MCIMFPHRDDGFKLWDALHKYVKGVVEHRYPSDQVNHLNFCSFKLFWLDDNFIPKDVAEDEELAGFHASLADPKKGNIPGFPQTPGSR